MDVPNKIEYAIARGTFDATSLQDIAKRNMRGFLKVLAPSMQPANDLQKRLLYREYSQAYDKAKT